MKTGGRVGIKTIVPCATSLRRKRGRDKACVHERERIVEYASLG